MGGLHVVITIYSSVETCVMGEEREGGSGREWEEGMNEETRTKEGGTL